MTTSLFKRQRTAKTFFSKKMWRLELIIQKRRKKENFITELKYKYVEILEEDLRMVTSGLYHMYTVGEMNGVGEMVMFISGRSRTTNTWGTPFGSEHNCSLLNCKLPCKGLFKPQKRKREVREVIPWDLVLIRVIYKNQYKYKCESIFTFVGTEPWGGCQEKFP